METTTTPHNPTHISALLDHLTWKIKEGHTVSVYENKDYVSVETTLPFDPTQTDIEIFCKSTGKKITRESTMKEILHGLIREG
jgi:hypothetical protein